MSISLIIAIYFVVWWTVLFAILPWGTRTQDEEGEVTLGTTSSAPAKPRLLRVAVLTTIAAAVIVGALQAAVIGFGLDLASFAKIVSG